ncbi:MAG: DUF5615 family PIN-like protein [Bacteroidia bacterium]|nr:DUF5615 family PIN-like protein [Bacteroidia bacterium]
MKLNDFGFLADENIHPKVITQLLSDGMRVLTVKEVNLNGKSDGELLHFAKENTLIVLTHDADFGKIIYAQKSKFTGILYLRPGHIKPEFTIITLKAVFANDFNLEASFVIVAEQVQGEIRIRVRQF